MQASISNSRKRPVNLTLSEDLVTQARAFTGNLSATLEGLLAGFVQEQRQLRSTHQQMADACAEEWNTVHAELGSFADEHSAL